MKTGIDPTPFRKFPADLILASGLPFIAAGLAAAAIFSLDGYAWLGCYAFALLLSLLGTAALFRAKLPLYRRRIFFSLGAKGLPATEATIYRIGIALSLAGIVGAILLTLASLLWQ
ncbi:hypothetical protein DB345_02305 [Spartobacteria bacterium LR76]|nr:hypothetical protein DB345_02305 [Spartobacteria bacterium LR76]